MFIYGIVYLLNFLFNSYCSFLDNFFKIYLFTWSKHRFVQLQCLLQLKNKLLEFFFLVPFQLYLLTITVDMIYSTAFDFRLGKIWKILLLFYEKFYCCSMKNSTVVLWKTRNNTYVTWRASPMVDFKVYNHSKLDLLISKKIYLLLWSE